MAIPGQQHPTIGYFVSTAVEDYVYIGGVMVTDAHGLPIEFRYTEPVRANRLQRVLYGNVLEQFIHTDVILTNLIERLEQKPGLMIVSDPSHLRSVGDNGLAGVWLGETRLPKLASTGDVQEISADEFLLQLAQSAHPIRVKTLCRDAGGPVREDICRNLVNHSESMEVLEPSRRILSAINLIWEESEENPLQPILDRR